MEKITLTKLADMKRAGEKIACLTAYDASFAALLEDSGVEVVLVGDSLGNVIQGRGSTLPVNLDDMVYHTRCAAAGVRRALLVADLPFATFADPKTALASAARLMQAGANVVKLEGGAPVLESVAHLAAFGIPVCAHLGLLPQSVNKLGGYRVQGRDPDQARALIADARALQEAGADMLVLECVPAGLAAQVSADLGIPVIGIGAGVECDGQVLVLYDLLEITPGRRPKFCPEFGREAGVRAILERYVAAVKGREFPRPEHSYGD